MFSLRSWLTAGVLVFAQQALAVDVVVQVFLDEAPLRNVEVTVDDTLLGTTDRFGIAAGEVAAGDHEARLSDGEFAFPFAFSSTADEDVEVTVTFTSSTGDKPVIETRNFAPGQPGAGVITGIVRDSAGEAMEGVSVSAGGRSTVSGAGGLYELTVDRGSYAVTYSADGYETITVPGVRVLAGGGIASQVKMYRKLVATDDDDGAIGPAPLMLEEVVVMGTFQMAESGSDLERYATSIVNAIDIEQLERFGDSDVASALTRVVGVAVQDDKYANVRGLDGRYISSTLNGMLMPSTDPMRRDVQLDLFPTNILGGIEISKAFEPSNMATTTGGAISIKTKGLPDEFTMKVSSSLGYNPDFTGDDIVSHRGSSTDWAGYDDGLRELKDSVLRNTNQGLDFTVCNSVITTNCLDELTAAATGLAMQDDYNVKDGTALPDVGFGVSIGDRLPAGDGEWGYYVAANYKRSTGVRSDATLDNPFEKSGSYRRAENNVDVSAYGVVGYEYGYANEILSKTSILRSTQDMTRAEDALDEVEDQDIYKVILQYVERQFISQAFTGHNEFEFGSSTHELDWGLSYSQTDRYEPDRRQYQYYGGFLSTSAFERRWSELTEDSYDATIDYKIPLDWGDYNTTTIAVGALYSQKQREVDLYRFGFGFGSVRDIQPLSRDKDLEKDVLPYQNFITDRVRLTTNTSITDSYEADEDIFAYYASVNTEFGDSWSVMFGARYEEFTQELAYPNSPTAGSELDVDNFYPMVNVTWRPLEELQIRAAYSETVSYPGIIERADSQSFDPVTDDPIFGNPDLIASTIDNFDIRAEWYFSDTESISLAAFYKDISNPIERALPSSSGSAADGITFRNQDGAELQGIEFDVNIDLIDSSDYLVFLGGNVSYIDSSVDLAPLSIQLEGADANGRQLQGQSEYLGNIQIGLDHYPTEQKATLLINYFDDRIFRIARGATAGSEIEVGRILIDFTYEILLGEQWKIGAQIKNLLNDEVEFSQNGRTIESWQNGTSVSVSASYEFL